MTEPNGITCRLDYIRSIPGVLKLIELVCDLLAVILSGAARVVDNGSGHRGFFIFVSVFALIGTLALFIIAVMNIRSMLLRNRWFLIEFCWCAVMALFYFIASIVIASIAPKEGIYGAAAFFGFAAFITYIADAVFQFRAHKAGSYGQSDQQYGQSAAAYPQRPTYDQSAATYPPQPPTYRQDDRQQQTGGYDQSYTKQQTVSYTQQYTQQNPATYDEQKYPQS